MDPTDADGSASDFQGTTSAMEGLVVVAAALLIAALVGLCVKYKTRKDPAFSGTEGKIRINSANSDVDARNILNSHSPNSF